MAYSLLISFCPENVFCNLALSYGMFSYVIAYMTYTTM